MRTGGGRRANRAAGRGRRGTTCAASRRDDATSLRGGAVDCRLLARHTHAPRTCAIYAHMLHMSARSHAPMCAGTFSVLPRVRLLGVGILFQKRRHVLPFFSLPERELAGLLIPPPEIIRARARAEVLSDGDALPRRPSSLVVNTTTRHLVVTGPIPIWVTTSAKRTLGCAVPGSFPGVPEAWQRLARAGRWCLLGLVTKMFRIGTLGVVTDRSTT